MATEVGQLTVKIDVSDVKTAEAAIERFGDKTESATSKTQQFTGTIGRNDAEVRRQKTTIDKATSSIDNYGDEAQDSAIKIDHLSNQAAKSNVKVGDFGRKAGMAGIQVEQMAGQIAMGVNPLRAIGVQAADLGFILGVPLLGAVVGIGAAIGSVLIPMLFSASKDTEELVDQFTDLDRVFNELTIAQQTVYLADMNEKIAEMNEESANAQEEIDSLVAEMNRMSGSGAMVEGQMKRLIDQMMPYQAIIDTNAQLTAKMTEALNAESSAEREAREEKEKTEKQSARAAEREIQNTIRKMEAAEKYTERLLGLADTEIGAIQRKEATQLETINRYRAENLISEQDYQNALTAILASASQVRQEIKIKEDEEERVRAEQRIQRITNENDRLMEGIIADDEKRRQTAMQTTDQLLAFEDRLMKGKSEKQKAAVTLGINLANAEKRENAKTIISDSYAAAMKAYKSLAGIPFVGPALGAAAAAAILGAGVSYAAQSMSGRALGGQVRAGESYVVGERGAEILTMGSSGSITPNEALKGASEPATNKTANVSFNIQANDTEGFDQLLSSRRGQIISIINEALNDQGRAALV